VTSPPSIGRLRAPLALVVLHGRACSISWLSQWKGHDLAARSGGPAGPRQGQRRAARGVMSGLGTHRMMQAPLFVANYSYEGPALRNAIQLRRLSSASLDLGQHLRRSHGLRIGLCTLAACQAPSMPQEFGLGRPSNSPNQRHARGFLTACSAACQGQGVQLQPVDDPAPS